MKFFTTKRGLRGAKAGFTLIELLVVIAIIGILASIITASLGSARAKGRDAKRLADIRTIQLSLEEYYNDNNSYPIVIYGVGSAPSAAFAPYISVMPLDPKDNSTQYKYSTWNANNSQVCTNNTVQIGYHLGAALEDPSNAALIQDRDFTRAGTICGGSPDFNGTSVGVSNACTSTAGTPQPNGTETCYDVTN